MTTIQPTGPDPAIHRRRLLNELRRSREASGRTQKQVTAAMDWSVSKLIRIEAGTVNISTNDLRALLSFYALPSERIGDLLQMAKAARASTPYAPWRNDVSTEYGKFLGYEASASIIRNFEPTLVPGLLQTEEYAHAVIQGLNPQDRVDSLVDLRMQRQEILIRTDPPDMHFILDEAVILRSVGGAELMQQQVRHILELVEGAPITVRVVPFRHGMYPQMRTPYQLFEFATDEDEDVLYVENPLGEVIRENAAEENNPLSAATYLGHFWEIEQIAPKEDAVGLLQAALKSFG